MKNMRFLCVGLSNLKTSKNSAHGFVSERNEVKSGLFTLGVYRKSLICLKNCLTCY